MPKFDATVKLTNLDATDPTVVRKAIEECMQDAGFDSWRILSVETRGENGAATNGGAPRRKVKPLVADSRIGSTDARGFLLVAAAALAIWFFFFLAQQ